MSTGRTADERERAQRRAALLQELAEMRGLRQRLHPQRTRLARDRAMLLRQLGRL